MLVLVAMCLVHDRLSRMFDKFYINVFLNSFMHLKDIFIESYVPKRLFSERVSILHPDHPDFVEKDHPRAGNGMFTAGNGAGPIVAAPSTSKPVKKPSVSSANLPTVAIKVTTERAYSGKRIDTTTVLTKQQSGALGEAVILAYLKHSGMADARQTNDKATNFAVDLVAGDHCIEAKTGLVSNNDKSHHWRATIGQPSKATAEWLKSATAEEKSDWTQKQYREIMARKDAAVAKVSGEIGRPLGKRTVTTILNPDTKTADIYVFDGFHLSLTWKNPNTEKAYVGSFKYE